MKQDDDYFLDTYTIKEEKQYKQRQIIINPYVGLALYFVFATVSIFSWDGAGDTWTCSKCGKSNYNWQMGCSCGN